MSAKSLIDLCLRILHMYYCPNFLALSSPFLGKHYRENIPELSKEAKTGCMIEKRGTQPVPK